VEGAEESLLGAAVHLVNFTFVTNKAAAVSEALKFLATLDVALVRSVMFVHVFAVDKISQRSLLERDLGLLTSIRIFGRKMYPGILDTCTPSCHLHCAAVLRRVCSCGSSVVIRHRCGFQKNPQRLLHRDRLVCLRS
jgi:hypothetical protein